MPTSKSPFLPQKLLFKTLISGSNFNISESVQIEINILNNYCLTTWVTTRWTMSSIFRDWLNTRHLWPSDLRFSNSDNKKTIFPDSWVSTLSEGPLPLGCVANDLAPSSSMSFSTSLKNDKIQTVQLWRKYCEPTWIHTCRFETLFIVLVLWQAGVFCQTPNVVPHKKGTSYGSLCGAVVLTSFLILLMSPNAFGNRAYSQYNRTTTLIHSHYPK